MNVSLVVISRETSTSFVFAPGTNIWAMGLIRGRALFVTGTLLIKVFFTILCGWFLTGTLETKMGRSTFLTAPSPPHTHTLTQTHTLLLPKKQRYAFIRKYGFRNFENHVKYFMDSFRDSELSGKDFLFDWKLSELL